MSIISKIHNVIKKAAYDEQTNPAYKDGYNKTLPFMNTASLAGFGTISLFLAKAATNKLAKAGFIGAGISLFIIGADYAVNSYKASKDAKIKE